MKKSLFGIAAISLMFLFAGTGIVLAASDDGSRMGMGGYAPGSGGGYGTFGGEYCGGPGSGTGMPYICEGETKTFENFIVTGIGVYGAGLGGNMTISKSKAEGEASYTIFGLGPWWFWNQNEFNLPAVGDTVTVNAKEIDISGTKRIVAMSVTVYVGSEATLELRDPETCYPNWAGGWSR